ncbi:polysaccharide deacetylase family protein [Hathewaya histolytica]|uniref:Polysaccharide deacetylase family protein n=1 Tax=Hathewaya histolytica TaxID=1498 RepID=A0A4V6KE42_HATHI|nr:polysaccharide deacetylase family protein [Hathewaya histolytica]VTQ93207.1 polysaccharide deacetylase family protein [Hathewaya histolytica]
MKSEKEKENIKNKKKNLNEKIKRRNKRMDFFIYSGCLFGIFALGIFIGCQLFNISTESQKAYAKVNDINSKKEDLKIETNKASISTKALETFNSTTNKKLTKENTVNSNVENIKPQNNEKFKDEKICYLTFDDGPTKNVTPEILNILKSKDVKATFFVLGKMAEVNSDLILREKREGHLVANHTYSHDYKHIYSNPNNLLQDFKKCHNVLKKILGEEPAKIVRFPGGSFNKVEYQKKVNKEGFHFVDWNCLNGDAEALNIPEEKLFNKVKNTMGSQKHIVVLMHDSGTKQTTVRSLEKVIEHIKSQGYKFKTLDEAF